DRVYALRQVGDADLLLEFEVAAVKGALAVAGQIEYGFAQRLAGNGSGVQGHPADPLAAVNDRHAFAEFGRGNRALLAGRAAADDDQIKTTFARGQVLSRAQGKGGVHLPAHVWPGVLLLPRGRAFSEIRRDR